MTFYYTLVYVVSFLGIFLTVFYAMSLFLDYRTPKKLSSKLYSLTIIIPAYNEEASIAATIESALNIDYPREKLEIIVVNDGSKDKTYEIAKKFESKQHPYVRVLTKPNGGKGSALNLGISKAKGEIVITMDADTFVNPDAVKEMMKHFYNDRVMAVTPAMMVYKPNKIWQRVQQIEYNLGVFLRKAFSTINAVHVTPGAFSAYRKVFFERYGSYDEHNITEDLEIALRIQSHHYIIENAPKAVVYTIAPSKFRELMIQRKRWYSGMIKNLMKYYFLFGTRYGILGILVLPLAILTVFSTIFLTGYTLSRSVDSLKEDLVSLNAVNFDFNNFYEFSKFAVQHHAYSILSQPVFVIFLVFVVFLTSIMIFSKYKTKFKDPFGYSLLLFIFTFSVLFSFWWILSLIYVLFNREIIWRGKK